MSNAAAGVFFYSVSTNRFLYLLRSDNKSPTWSMPGGTIDAHETLLEGLTRECFEEMRVDITNFKLVPIQKFTNNSFVYHTFFCRVDDEFIPILHREHVGYAWVEQNNYPKPLHPGLFSTINIDLVIEKLQFLIN
jgi:8-oxo-dGTP pyrophosphatase MutT (NUDIX family)